MDYESRVSRGEIFVATACVGAHANAPADGFRLKDLSFLIELFSNWTERGSSGARIQPTQISRFLEKLVSEGFARRLAKRKAPTYRLTRIGLIEMLSRLTGKPYFPAREHFYFLVYFLKNYKPRLEELVRAEGREFPYSLKLELEELLDVGALVSRELAHCDRERKKLQVRISDAEKTSQLARSWSARGVALEEIVREAQRLYPYELNSQKPLTELISGIPPEMRSWELETGNMMRVSDIWQPALRLLDAYIRELQRLSRDAPALRKR